MSPAESGESSSVAIDPGSRITLGAAGAVIVAFVGGALWINNELKAIRSELFTVRLEISSNYASRAAVLDTRVTAIEKRLGLVDKK